MFHYTPAASYSQNLSSVYRDVPLEYHQYTQPGSALTARDNYLNALANAKAAEAQYLAAESAQREEEALLRRLQEIQLQKRYALSPTATPYGYPPVEDRLSILRRQIEEEERKRAELESERAATALASQRLRFQEIQSRRQRAEEQAALTQVVQLRQRQGQDGFPLFGGVNRPARRPVQESRTIKFVVNQDETPVVPQRSRCSCAAKCAPTSTSDHEKVLQAIFGNDSGAYKKQKPSKKVAPSEADGVLKFIFGAPPSQEASKSAPNTQTPAKKSTPAASTPAPQHPEVVSLPDLIQQLFQVPSAPKAGKSDDKPVASPEVISLQDVIQQIFQVPSAPKPGKSEAKPVASQSSSKEPVDKVQPQASANPVPAPTEPAPLSLKEQLEQRLYSEEAVEIRDTIQAIFASLAEDSAPNARPSTSVPASASTSKGKGKAPAKAAKDDSAVPVNATSQDVVSALDTVRSIEVAFRTLESEFVFPPELDFATSSASSPVSSDNESSAITSKLAYTSRNQPVRYYEQSLSGLISQLDEVESFGNDELRQRRKEVVGKVEKAIEELESEIEGRWRSKVSKEKRVSASFEVVDIPKTAQLESESATSAEALTTAPSAEAPAAAPEAVEALEESSGEIVESVEESTEVATVEEAPVPAVSEQSAPATSAGIDTASPADTPLSAADSETQQDAQAEISVPSLSASSLSSYPPATSDSTSTSYPPTVASSVVTLKPYDVDQSEDPSDTFLLRSEDAATDTAKKSPVKKARDDDVGSDWSEVDA